MYKTYSIIIVEVCHKDLSDEDKENIFRDCIDHKLAWKSTNKTCPRVRLTVEPKWNGAKMSLGLVDGLVG